MPIIPLPEPEIHILQMQKEIADFRARLKVDALRNDILTRNFILHEIQVRQERIAERTQEIE